MIFMKFFGRAMVGIMLSILAGDILYLYYAGGWIEPIQVILISELVMLYGLVAVGIFMTGRVIGEASR